MVSVLRVLARTRSFYGAGDQLDSCCSYRRGDRVPQRRGVTARRITSWWTERREAQPRRSRSLVPGETGGTMQNVMNRRWLLATYPEGMPTSDNWIIDKQPVPDPGAGQILVKAKWLSVDPYMRGRISPATNYTKGTTIGEVMQGGGVGEVVVSNHPAWKTGDIAESMSFGWQEWSVLTPDIAGPAGVNRIDPGVATIESSLSWLGMPGLTAYFGLLELGRPRPGDTVVVSAASGA